MTPLLTLQSGQQVPGSTAALALRSSCPSLHTSGEYAPEAAFKKRAGEATARRNGRGIAFSTGSQELLEVFTL